VSNSSSSSFICSICNRIETVYDDDDDIDAVECSSGHLMCKDHLFESTIPSFSMIEKILQDEVLEINLNKNFTADKCKEKCDRIFSIIEEFRIASSDEDKYKDIFKKYKQEIIEYIIDEYNEISNAVCPICNLDKIENKDLIRYIIKEYSIDKNIITKKIKEKFKNYKEFKTYLN
jgi:hypothetical protein